MESRRISEVRFNREHMALQHDINKNNILSICKFAIKDVIDTACIEPMIPEDSSVVQNFCTVIEHVLNHRLKAQQTWYGVREPPQFWDFIRLACRGVKNNSLSSIHSLEAPKTAAGKGRAWIRMALMEKRLAEYLLEAIKQTAVTKQFYHDNAILLGDDVQQVCSMLLGLNAIDFSFDIRGQQLDFAAMPVIDFTPYMKFHQSPESQRRDTREEIELERMSESIDIDNGDLGHGGQVQESQGQGVMEHGFTGGLSSEKYWRVRAYKLEKSYRNIAEQKGYLEELVRLRDHQLGELTTRHAHLVQTLRHYEAETKRDRKLLENVIIELQAQVMSLKEDQQYQKHVTQMQSFRYDAQSEVMTPVRPQRPTSAPNVSAQQGAAEEIEMKQRSPSLLHQTNLLSPDTRSIMSAGSNISVALAPPDTESMVPMVGSFTDDTGVPDPNTEGCDPVSANENREEESPDQPPLHPANQAHMSHDFYASVCEELREGDLDQAQVSMEMAEVLEELTQSQEHTKHVQGHGDHEPGKVKSGVDVDVVRHLSSPRPDLVAECERVDSSSDEDRFEFVDNQGTE